MLGHPLYALREFYQTGRKKNGSYMGEHEDVVNATQRNLSCLTEEEIKVLMKGATALLRECANTMIERYQDVPGTN